jgi:flavin-dependent dehydrogenase
MVGDAFTFVDPVFSTGVYLAMASAFLGADAVDACLREPRRAAAALRRYEARARRGLGSFTWFIYRIPRPAFRHLFMAPRNYFRIEEAVLSLLAGDVYGRSPIGSRLLLFKALYYVTSLLHLTSSVRTWRIRRRGAPAAAR